MKIFFLLFLFHPLFAITLNEYIKLSLKNSNDARGLVENNINTRLNYTLEENKYNSNYSPISSFQTTTNGNSFTIGVQGSKQNIYGGTTYASLDGTRGDYHNTKSLQYSSNLTFGYKQSLFQRFGEVYNTVSLYAAKEKIRLIKIFDKEQQATIILKAVGYYYDAVLNKAKIAIQKKSLKRVQSNYDAAQAKQKSGLVSKIDVYRAKLLFLDQKKNLNDSITRYKDSLENLYYYLNQDVNKNAKINETLAVKIIKDNFKQKKQSAILSENIEWNTILLDEELLKRDLYKADKDFLPDLTLDMNYKRYSLNGDLNHAIKLDENSWSLVVSSNYGFNTTEQNINKQKVIIRKSKLERDKRSLKRLIFKDINTLKNSYQNILENLEIYKLKKKEAKNSLNVSKLRYERGLSSNLDILDAESAYSSSQIEYVSEVLRYNFALLKYAKAMNNLDINYVNKVIK